MKIGLFFGSFNPVHNGHLAIANFLKQKNIFDQIWMVVSPNNPLKNKNELICENYRLEMVKLAIQDFSFFKACEVELSMPKPSYTIDTLKHLGQLYPVYEFSLILGGDNIMNFHKWKNYKEILNNYKIFLYPRHGMSLKDVIPYPNIICLDAPLLTISATEIRAFLKQGKMDAEFIPELVMQYIKEKKIYLKSKNLEN